MDVLCIDPTENPLWSTLANRYPSTVFHAPAWLRVLKQTYGFDLRAYVIVDENGGSQAGLPFCMIQDIMPDRIVSLPFSDFCDPLVDRYDDWLALSNGLFEADCRINMRCIHNNLPLKDDRLKIVNRAKWHCVDLQRDLDEIWAGLRGSARRAIGKARRKNIDVCIATDKRDLRAFYELHLRLRKYKYQLLAQPYSFFERIWDEFIAQDQGALVLARRGDEIVAGILFLEWQSKLYYKFNASNPDYSALRPNDLALWQGIQYGVSKGHKYLDFGLSDWDQEGLLRYKRKYATSEETISLLRYEPDNATATNEKAVRKLLPQITNLFVDREVSDTVTEQAGNILYRFFT